MLKAHIQTSPNSGTHVHVAPIDFQAELLSKLIVTGTHLRKWAIATLSYSPASTPQPQVIYTIAFSTGLNGLQVTKLIERTINEVLSTLQIRSNRSADRPYK